MFNDSDIRCCDIFNIKKKQQKIKMSKKEQEVKSRMKVHGIFATVAQKEIMLKNFI